MSNNRGGNGTLRNIRASLLDDTGLDYDTEERNILVHGLEKAVDTFLQKKSKAFTGWVVTDIQVHSDVVVLNLGNSDGMLHEITQKHFDDVRKYLRGFELQLPVHNTFDHKSRSARETHQCFLEYNIEKGEKNYARARTIKIVLVSLLIVLVILFCGVLGIFFKHTEHDSLRLGPLWRILYPDF